MDYGGPSGPIGQLEGSMWRPSYELGECTKGGLGSWGQAQPYDVWQGGHIEFDLLVSLYSLPTFCNVICFISNDILRVVSPMLVLVFDL